VSQIELPRPEELNDQALTLDPDGRSMQLIIEGRSERRWREVSVGSFILTEIVVRTSA
jgi:hypothetical protein